MPRTARVLEVFIASPSDVFQERDVVEKIVHNWNAVHYGTSNPTVLLPIRWELHSYPALEGRAQSIINRKLLKNADILVAIFKGRLGQTTGRHDSGTVEEIEECYEAGVPILLYFNEIEPTQPEFGVLSFMFGDYAAEWKRHAQAIADFGLVQNYRRKCQDRGLVGAYRSIEEFYALVQRHLSQTIVGLRNASKSA